MIEVEGPDGAVLEFPDGTSQEVIRGAMARHYGKPNRVPTPQELSPDAPKGRPESTLFRDVGAGIVDAARAITNGIPFTDRLAAAVGPRFNSAGQETDYDLRLAAERARQSEIDKAHPILSGAGKFAGGTAAALATLPISGPATGATLLGNMGRGALAGAGMGAVYGVSDTPDLTNVPQAALDTAKGAATGFGIGAALPVAGRVAGATWRAAAPFFERGPDGMSRQARGILSLGLRPEASTRLSDLGRDAMLVDASPSTLGIGQGVAAKPGLGRDLLVEALERRNLGTNARINAAIDRAMGPAEDPQVVTNAIRAHRSAVDARNYPAAFDTAPPVDIGPVARNLDDMIENSVGMENKALAGLRGMILRPNPAYAEEQAAIAERAAMARALPTVPQSVPVDRANILHKIKGELDNVIEYDAPGLGVPPGAVARQQGALRTMRGQLNEALENQVPGYADANRASAALARRAEAVETGTGLLDSGKTAVRPATFEQTFAGMEPGERIALAKGLRGEVDRLVGTKANDLQALKQALQGEGGWNTAKMGTVYGREPIDEMVRAVDANQAFRDVYGKVAQGSQTAQRTAASQAIDTAAPDLAIPKDATIIGLLGRAIEGAGRKGLEFATRSTNDRVRNELALALIRQGQEASALLDHLNRAATLRAATGEAIEGAVSNPAIAAALLSSVDPWRRSEAR